MTYRGPFTLVSFETPQRIPTLDAELPDGTIIYFDCAGCLASEPAMAGYMGKPEPDGKVTVVLWPLDAPRTHQRPAIFCPRCFATLVADYDRQQRNAIDVADVEIELEPPHEPNEEGDTP